jgi:hypothetical protein
MSFFRPVVASLVLALAVAAPAYAGAQDSNESQGRWEKLGEHTVDGKMDRDSISVGSHEGPYTAIQVKVEGGSVVVYDIKVVFSNGTTFDPVTRLVFDKNTTTRTIDLPGDKRLIKRVDFRYGNLGGRPRVELWGKEVTGSDSSGSGGTTAPPATAGAWSRLGERTVEGKMDRDTIAVGADDGAFSAIQIKVEGGSLAMYEIKVVFLNGSSFEPKTRLVFDRNTTTRIIDLPGDKRVIKRVDFRYGNLGGGRARVELWGRK